ncbi:hypothetical protein FISHEDRAFT_34182 [Fistulina hepatica ATCC 64428]|uniref:Fatty acid hydroxylase domain-containing protein n=1 Tax=Fistulina hepatica ATCC 64428 TaxID=1128425 RepID=A0A0D7ANL6_9AGAR|nr:hypothetical protein FISHEDRAFT_34182 [Fistulina hepatica ATCC 64428]
MTTNATVCFENGQVLCDFSPQPPFYFSQKTTLIDGVSDQYVALAAPIVAYWAMSLFFHCFDMSDWKWLEKYRLHPPAEVQARNLVTRTQVIWAVIFQQIIQTLLGILWLDSEPEAVDHYAETLRIGQYISPTVSSFVSWKTAVTLVPQLAYTIYWHAIPVFQLIMAMFIIDTWQYALHRTMHENKWLYKKFHSWHHRLYVPYAFGALYNHPVEGFLLDSLGALIAELLTKMSTRQAMLLFAIATFKTVDDHCGYSLPWDPFQLMTSNNAAYHDIHHQSVGIKYNYAQPFFVHWDTILHTRMTREEMERRIKENREKAKARQGKTE